MSARCCNPFLKKKHAKITIGVRLVTHKWSGQYTNIVGKYLCNSCRLESNKENHLSAILPAIEKASCTESHDEYVIDNEIFSSDAEDSDETFCMVPKNKKLDSRSKNSTADNKVAEEMKIALLKERNKQTKMRILTTALIEWSAAKIQRNLGVTRYMAETSIKLRQALGFNSSITPKAGRRLPEEIVKKVQTFYESEEYCRIMPGKKDCISISRDGHRENVQKKLLLYNLKELHAHFLTRNPDIKICLSKFTKLRPPYCVVVGCSGSHNVCVCKIHQNMKLKLHGLNNALRGCDSNEQISIQDVTNGGMCSVPNEFCHMQNCVRCPRFPEKFGRDISETLITTYKQWSCTDRCELIDVSESIETFWEKLKVEIPSYKKHDFIAKSQNEYFSKIKENLKDGEYLVALDFSENYSFKIQDAVQSYHWSNDQATLHPYVIYYKIENTTVSECFAVISECNEHDTVAVHLFNKKLIDYIKTTFGSENVQKIIYFSDGCAGQYKNKYNFANLVLHESDYGIKCEWHFFATSHGKGACDGVGGTIKRLASKASLQRPMHNQITTPQALYQWAEGYFENIAFAFCSKEEHRAEEKELCARFQSAMTIKGTRSYHSFVPINNISLQTKEISASDHLKIHNVFKNK